MLDKRHYKRFIVEDMDIRARTRFATKVDIMDLSLGGASIKGTKMLTIGNTYNFTLDNNNANLTLRGQVVWEKIVGSIKISKEDIAPVYLSGIEFDNVMSEKAKGLIDFIDKVIAAKRKRMKGLGLSVSSEDGTELAHFKGENIKVLSVSGILVEAEHKQEIGTEAKLSLSLPKDEEPIGLVGRVLSCIELPNSEPTLYDIGYEIISVPHDESRARLERYISQLNQKRR